MGSRERIAVLIRDDGEVDTSKVSISVDGVPAIVRGEVAPEFVTVDQIFQDTSLLWTFRAKSPMPPRDILVTGNYGPSKRLIESRFYIKGAKEKISRRLEYDEQWCRDAGGILVSSHGQPFPGGLSLRKDGEVRYGDKKWKIPKAFLGRDVYLAPFENSWSMVSGQRSRTYVYNTTDYHEYHFGSKNVKITNGMIHMVVAKDRTLHIPCNYRQASQEIYWDDLFQFRHNGDWEMDFYDNVHIWHNPKSFIVKRMPNPLTGESDDMLWTADDLKVPEITSVRSVNIDQALVNEKFLVDTHAPQITPL